MKGERKGEIELCSELDQDDCAYSSSKDQVLSFVFDEVRNANDALRNWSPTF